MTSLDDADSLISLRPVVDTNWREALTLAVRPDQQRFVADHAPLAALVLAKAYIRPGGLTWAPYVICRGEGQVGMLQLVHADQPDADCSLYHFFVDRRFQGQGIGAAALRLLLDLVRREHPHRRSLRLTVHPDNRPAQQLYAAFGFVPTGEVLDGEPVYALAL